MSRTQTNNKGNGSNKAQECKNRSNNKKPNTNKQSNVRTSTSNPYTWYANFPHFSADVATLAFGHPVGQPVYYNDVHPITAAGICTLWYGPAVGVSTDNTSPINRQAGRFQTYLRSIQRSASTYDAADSMIYMLAIDSLYSYWAYLRRAYGVAQLFTPTNKYYPKRLLQAMNIDDSVADDLSRFRAYINKFALNIGRFALPKKFDLAERHKWMNTGLYVDSTTTRAQTYMFCPTYLWQYDNTVSTGSELKPYTIKEDTPKTLDRLIEIGRELMTALENDDDTMAISGDIYRAYGQSGLMTVEETVEGYTILPVYDTVVLSQIENATIVGSSNYKNWKITQNPSVNNGAIIFTPTTTPNVTKLQDNMYGANVAAYTSTPCMNMHMDSPSPDAVMEATRLLATSKNKITKVGPATAESSITACGTEIVLSMELMAFNPTNTAAARFLVANTQTIYVEMTTNELTKTAGLELMALLHQFDWAPMLYIAQYDKNNATSGINVIQVDCDMDNFTTVKYSQLEDIHEAAILSLLDIGTPGEK